MEKISGKKFKRINIVAGICMEEWVAPMEYGGTTDSVLFEFWFENCLMKEAKPGSVIVLDNATFHKKSVLHSLAEQYGCTVVSVKYKDTLQCKIRGGTITTKGHEKAQV